MTDDKTLVARLRERQTLRYMADCKCGYCHLVHIDDICYAADRIEALEEALRWIKNMPLIAPPLDDPAHNMRTIATRALGGGQ